MELPICLLFIVCYSLFLFLQNILYNRYIPITIIVTIGKTTRLTKHVIMIIISFPTSVFLPLFMINKPITIPMINNNSNPKQDILLLLIQQIKTKRDTYTLEHWLDLHLYPYYQHTICRLPLIQLKQIYLYHQ